MNVFHVLNIISLLFYFVVMYNIMILGQHITMQIVLYVNMFFFLSLKYCFSPFTGMVVHPHSDSYPSIASFSMLRNTIEFEKSSYLSYVCYFYGSVTHTKNQPYWGVTEQFNHMLLILHALHPLDYSTSHPCFFLF